MSASQQYVLVVKGWFMRVHKNGFTLIELILGIVIFAIALTIIVGLIAPQARQSAEPLIQLKASELGQSLMNEILSKSFDEHSERAPPFRRCSETTLGAEPCTDTGDFGLDETETRTSYDDVDDYVALSGQAITNAIGEELVVYQEFSLEVQVEYDSDYNANTSDGGVLAKRITVTVISPLGERYGFTSYKANY